ncbi:MAG TPA: hypothetical protein VJ697_16885 [Nitrososphaeraceae archaeon]|nr:hypothetical protein [Nitrososphaeraceae archaeon]
MRTENIFNDDKNDKKRLKIFLSAFTFLLCLTLIILSLLSTIPNTNYSSFFCMQKNKIKWTMVGIRQYHQIQ